MLTAGLPISLLSFYALSIYSEDICWATSVPFTLVSRMKKRKLKDHPAHWGATMAEVLDTMVIRPSFRTVGLQCDMPRVSCHTDMCQRVPLVSRLPSTRFHLLKVPLLPTVPQARDQASHVQAFQILRINHNVSLLTCLSQVQVHSHCLPSEALWLFFLCGLILDG